MDTVSGRAAMTSDQKSEQTGVYRSSTRLSTRLTAMKRKLIVIALILASVAGAGAFYGTRGSDTPRFQTVAVTRGSIVDAIEATGTLEPVDPVQIGSQVSGTVVSLGTDFNQ